MTNPLSELKSTLASRPLYFAIWLFTTAVAVMLALLVKSASFVDGEYIPVGIDSFYHARRILDAAIGERGFYQFDNMIHVPEGSWINWPWAYDYLMAAALSAALWIRPSLEPMAFLAYVPVAWLSVNMGLLTLICRRIALSAGLTAVAMLGYAMLPLTQTLHGVGNIDHHYIELTFALATLWAGLGFFSGTPRTKDAVILGAVLGVAPAFHNGLFILQVPVLICFLALWLRQEMPDKEILAKFAAALIGGTIFVLLPSEPFRDLQFEFWTLSWFHLYVACCSAIGTLFLALRPFRRINVGLLSVLVIALIIPLFAKLLTGAAFLGGKLILLDQIAEVVSPIMRVQAFDGVIWVSSFYSWLVFLAPAIILLFAWRAWRAWQQKESQGLYFSIYTVFGLLLLLTQYRLHPFGSWALLVPTALLIQELSIRYRVSMLAATAGALLVLALAFQPPLRNRLIKRYVAAVAVDYAATRSLFKSLGESCAKEPGVAISYSDDGHYIRYHTDCSVVSNNFLMTPLHEQKILEVDAMLQLNPEQFLEQVKNVDYIFVRMYGVFEDGPQGLRATAIPKLVSENAPLFVALTFADELPREFQLIDEERVDDDRDFAYARVFHVVRDKK